MTCMISYTDSGPISVLNRRAFSGEGDVLLVREGYDASSLQSELERLLHSYERYGAISPRMQDGSWLSLPYNKGAKAVTPYKEALLRQGAMQYLLQVSIVPGVRASCVLVRRDVIDNLGFLDESFATIQGALTDFCCRVNQYGYSMVAANHLFLQGVETAHDDPEDQKKVLAKWPYWHAVVNHYMTKSLHVCEYFLTLLVKGYYEKTRILLNYTNMPAFHNGTSKVQLNVLRYLDTHFRDRFDIFVDAPQEAARFHHLDDYHITLVDPASSEETYHILYSASQPFYLEDLPSIKRCLKRVFTLLDIIMCRCDYLQCYSLWRDDVTRFNVELSDGLLYISQFGYRDFCDYYITDPNLAACPHKVVYLATDHKPIPANPDMKKFDQYVLIPGSSYYHKGVKRAYKMLSNSGMNCVFIGLEKEGWLAPNIYNYKGGNLTDEKIEQLYQQCSCMFFPSMYEGFGYPVIIAARMGKRTILLDNEINRELLSAFPELREQLVFVRSYEEAEEAIRSSFGQQDPQPARIAYSSDDANREITDFLLEMLNMPMDIQKLQSTWHLANELTPYPQPVPGDPPSLKSAFSMEYQESHPKLYRFVKRAYHLLKRS